MRRAAAAPSSSTEAPSFAPAMTRADSGQHSQGFRSGFHGKDVDLYLAYSRLDRKEYKRRWRRRRRRSVLSCWRG